MAHRYVPQLEPAHRELLHAGRLEVAAPLLRQEMALPESVVVFGGMDEYQPDECLAE